MGKELAASADDPAQVTVLVNLSGRGDKDVATAAKWFDLLDEPVTEEGQEP